MGRRRPSARSLGGRGLHAALAHQPARPASLQAARGGRPGVARNISTSCGPRGWNITAPTSFAPRPSGPSSPSTRPTRRQGRGPAGLLLGHGRAEVEVADDEQAAIEDLSPPDPSSMAAACAARRRQHAVRRGVAAHRDVDVPCRLDRFDLPYRREDGRTPARAHRRPRGQAPGDGDQGEGDKVEGVVAPGPRLHRTRQRLL
jgi:hypothetical protein